jgi:hypothetical protein
MAFMSEAAMERRQAIAFAERFIGRYGLGIAFIPWYGVANPCLRVSIVSVRLFVLKN